MIDEDLRAELLTKTAVTDLVGPNGVYVAQAEQSAGRPLVVLRALAGSPDYHAGGASGLEETFIDLRCEGRSPAEARDVYETIKPHVSGVGNASWNGTHVRSCMIDDGPKDTTEPPRHGDQRGFPSISARLRIAHE